MVERKYEDYKGYIIAPGITMPSYDIYEYEVFENFGQYEEHVSVHTAESETEAKQWVDRATDGLAREVQEEFVRRVTVEPLGRGYEHLADFMTSDDWDAEFAITPIGREELASRSFGLTRAKHTVMVKLDPLDQALWNVWSIPLFHLNEGYTLRQISDKIGSFRTMRSINHLVAEQYIVRK